MLLEDQARSGSVTLTVVRQASNQKSNTSPTEPAFNDQRNRSSVEVQ